LVLEFKVEPVSKTDGESAIVEGEIRRMRLKLDGFVYNPKFGYKVELGFSARDIGTVAVGIVEM
jgi:hypothetical protein